VDPNKISGALYHLVATYSVNIGYSSDYSYSERAKPKSATFALHSESNNTLEGFKSL
jgi:hypothetical protein